MARDCSFQLRKHNIAFLSYWPSAVRTELIETELKKGLDEASLATGNAQVNFKIYLMKILFDSISIGTMVYGKRSNDRIMWRCYGQIFGM